MSFFSKALLRDNMDLECFIFSNLADGLKPTNFSGSSIFFKKEYFLDSFNKSFLRLSNSKSEAIGLSLSK